MEKPKNSIKIDLINSERRECRMAHWQTISADCFAGRHTTRYRLYGYIVIDA